MWGEGGEEEGEGEGRGIVLFLLWVGVSQNGARVMATFDSYTSNIMD